MDNLIAQQFQQAMDGVTPPLTPVSVVPPVASTTQASDAGAAAFLGGTAIAALFADVEQQLPDAVPPVAEDWLPPGEWATSKDDLTVDVRRIAILARDITNGHAVKMRALTDEVAQKKRTAQQSHSRNRDQATAWRGEISTKVNDTRNTITGRGWGVGSMLDSAAVSWAGSTMADAAKVRDAIRKMEEMLSRARGNWSKESDLAGRKGPFTGGGAVIGAILFLILFQSFGGFLLGAIIGATGGFFLARYLYNREEGAVSLTVNEAQASVRAALDAVRGFEDRSAATLQTDLAAADDYQAKREAAIAAETHDAMQMLEPQVDAYTTRANAAVPPWTDAFWQTWTPPTAVQPYAAIGSLQLLLDSGPRFVPMVAKAPHGFNLVVHGWGANATIPEPVLMRMLTAIPPGKLEFTLIDPVGYGDNVASLMHLADHRKELISDKAWRTSSDIEQRLAILAGEMENIIQKYLRKTYQSMEEYNADAGVVAEPYRVLVVNNFPTNFDNDVVRNQLISLMTKGPKCGIYTAIAIDDSQETPYKFNVADVDRAGMVIRRVPIRQPGEPDTGANLGFSIREPALHTWMFLNEDPVPSDTNQRILDLVGKEAAANSVVQVPFADLSPTIDQWWTGSTRELLQVPIGITGARKHQDLILGRNTAQTALVIGRVGSGKSTLLHVTIMSLALTYSPEELELYLLDFKKGVEFKTYAIHRLPHAKAIAVESEREFALSVLQRLDRELAERGRLFREATANYGETPNIAAYREKTGKSLPRIILLVDEFQEFFTESDALAQQAGLLLDRLVRQGRAFGIHVMLGSQSLAGAYTLARSTIDQMAVRIALQCGEADSRLILSDDNDAARLLNRPGEAIYNDDNGREEGNDFFQTAWLEDDDRDAYLVRLRELAEARYPEMADPIVFEGNRPADVSSNRPLSALLGSATAASPGIPTAWLGDPVAIDDPVSVSFRQQAGSNLVIVGQDEPAAYGMLTTAMVSLARHHELTGDEAKIHLVDLVQSDAPHANVLKEVAEDFPGTIQMTSRRRLPDMLDTLLRETERRLALDDERLGPAMYLVIAGLQRARDLREDDTFGRGSFLDDEPSLSPSQQFTKLLRDGPDVGIHVLTWCDNVGNLGRTIGRSMREFDLRVATQMGAEDSNTLLDSTAASKLGENRALFFSEEQSQLMKFRPYGLPGNDWLHTVESRLAPARQTV